MAYEKTFFDVLIGLKKSEMESKEPEKVFFSLSSEKKEHLNNISGQNFS